MLAAISMAKNSKKIQPRVHVMRPAGTKRSTARMTNVTTKRLIVERHCTALTPLGLRAVLIRAKVTQNPQSKERSQNRQDWALSNPQLLPSVHVSRSANWKNKPQRSEAWPFEFSLVFASCCPKQR